MKIKVEDKKLEIFYKGEIIKKHLSEYINDYLVLCFYPADFTFVCPTELNAFSDEKEEFDKRRTNVLLVSTDTVYSHKAWASCPREEGGVSGIKWPMVADKNMAISKMFNLLNEENNLCMRATVILDRNMEIVHYSVMHDRIGRNLKEIIRIIDALEFINEHGDICPVNWEKIN